MWVPSVASPSESAMHNKRLGTGPLVTLANIPLITSLVALPNPHTTRLVWRRLLKHRREPLPRLVALRPRKVAPCPLAPFLLLLLPHLALRVLDRALLAL